MSKPETVTGAELAPMLNLTTRRIALLVAEGVIPRVGRSRFELVPAVAAYVTYLQGLAAGRGDNAHKNALTELAIERAKKAQRDNMKEAGELIPKTDVVVMIQGMFGHCRARLLAIPAKLAPTVHLAETVAETKEMITEAIHDALQELSETRVVGTKPEPGKRRRR